MATLFDYLPEKTLFVDMETNQAQGERFYLDAKQRYEHRKVDQCALFCRQNVCG